MPRIPDSWLGVMENFKTEVMMKVPSHLYTHCRGRIDTRLAKACGDDGLRRQLQKLAEEAEP